MMNTGEKATRTSGTDEIIREVREIREAYSARHGHDVRAILRKVRERASESSTPAIKPGEDRTSE
jgi:hypothetical protein